MRPRPPWMPLTAQVTADQSLIDASKQTIQSAQDQVSVTRAELGSAKGPSAPGPCGSQSGQDQSRAHSHHRSGGRHSHCPPHGCGPNCGSVICGTYRVRNRAGPDEDATRHQRRRVRCRQYQKPARAQALQWMLIRRRHFRGQVSDVRKAPIITQNVVTYDVVIAVANR